MCLKYTAHKKFMNGFACSGFDPYVQLFQQGAVRKSLYVDRPNKFCFKKAYPVL